MESITGKAHDRAFGFYESWRKIYERRQTPQQKVDFVDMIFKFTFDGIEPDESYEMYDVFLGIKNNLINSVSRIENGRKGGKAGKGISRNKGNQNARKNNSQNNSGLLIQTAENNSQNNSGKGKGKGYGIKPLPLPKQKEEWDESEASFCSERGCCNIENGECRCGQRPPRLLGIDALTCPFFKKAEAEKEVA